MPRNYPYSCWLLLLAIVSLQLPLRAQIPAFPGAEGFGAQASGGRGGQVIYVTNLNVSGPGSLQAALNTPGPRYILFKVSGVIPGTVQIPVGGGNFTLAGQTSPGGIIVRGLLAYNDASPTASNIIIRHLRSRIGDTQLYPTPHWLAEDGLTLGGVRNAIIDHCSFAHATDEAVDISRCSQLTIQYCMLSETLGSHAYLGGMLINYSSAQSQLDSLSIHHNLWNRIGGRMPEISCEGGNCAGKTLRMEVSNNLFWDQQIQMYYDPAPPFYVDANFVGNTGVGRSAYGGPLFNYNFLSYSANDLYVSGNSMPAYPGWSDYDLFYCCNDFNLYGPNTTLGQANRLSSRHPYPAISYTPAASLRTTLTAQAGAFPRDSMDRRLLKYVISNTFDPSPVDQAGANDPFLISNNLTPPQDSDNDGMPDSWELQYGLNPNQQDHNGSQLSVSLTGIAGYTNLECYLHQLAVGLSNPVASCDAPASTSLQASLITHQSARLQCLVTTFAGYDWRYRLLGASSWTDLPASSTPLYELGGLAASTQYEFQVKVQCGSSWSNWSESVRFLTAAPPCTAPVAAHLSVNGLSTVTAILNCSTPAVIAFDWRYRVQGSSSWTELPASTAPFVQLSGLSPATTYEYQVQVQCGINWSDWSVAQFFTTLTPPCSTPSLNQMTVSNISTQAATLHCAMTGVDQYGWRYRAIGAAGWTDLPATSGGSQQLSGLSQLSSYEFQVAIQCQGVWTGWSLAQSFSTLGSCSPPAAGQFTASAITTTTASLQCLLSGATAYDWRYRQQGSSSWTELPAGPQPTVSLGGLQPATSYEYQVAQQCGSLWSAWSVSNTFTTLSPPCPSPVIAQLSVSLLTPYTAQLNCSQSGVIAYDWRYRTIGSNSWTLLNPSLLPLASISNLQPTTGYEFQVAVQCSSNNWSGWSASQIFFTPEDQCLPPNFAQMGVTTLSSVSVRLHVYLSAGINTYDWRYRQSGAASWADLPATTVSHFDLTGLLPGSQYEYQAAVRCGSQWSQWSAARRFLTPSTLADQEAGYISQATEQQQAAASLLLLPVPVQQQLELHVRTAVPASFELQLHDMSGRLLLRQPLGFSAAAEQHHSLPLQGLPAGSYLLRLVSEKEILQARFVKVAD
jgi:pectate lyase